MKSGNKLAVTTMILQKLEEYGVKHCNAKFECYSDGVFTFNLEIGHSQFSEIEPTLLQFSLISDTVFFRDMPILELLNSPRTLFLCMSVYEGCLDDDRDDWDFIKRYTYKKESKATLN